MERLALREQAAQPLLNSGWTLLYSGLTPLGASSPCWIRVKAFRSASRFRTGETADDWDLWLEACNRQLSVPLRQWLESQGIEQTTLSRLTGADPGGEKPLKISNMLQVARWMESPIETIEALAESNRSQLVLHLAGLEANS